MQFTEEIYQKYAKMVYKYLLSMTHDVDVAEEITQETFYQAIKSINRFDESCSISTWLCAIAKNQLFAYQRKHLTLENFDTCNEVSISAEEKAIGALSRVELVKKLHLCPEPFREILYLRIFGTLSFKEIGEIMGQTENWARVIFYRGKERLRREIAADEKER